MIYGWSLCSTVPGVSLVGASLLGASLSGTSLFGVSLSGVSEESGVSSISSVSSVSSGSSSSTGWCVQSFDKNFSVAIYFLSSVLVSAPMMKTFCTILSAGQFAFAILPVSEQISNNTWWSQVSTGTVPVAKYSL